MSREGRWRLVKSGLRATFALGACALLSWGVWLVAASVRETRRPAPAVTQSVPMKRPELRTDGVLDDAWLVRALALPSNAALVKLDLVALKARLEAEPQVATATLTKFFPDRLVVQITERSPIARVMVQWLGEQRPLLVARDGVLYTGYGYDRSVLDTLPWLDGVKIVPDGGGFRPIAHMADVAELLGKARLEAEHLYATWNVVSLARLETDHKIEVRTKDGRDVIEFSTDDDFFRQLAKLDYITDTLKTRTPGAHAAIDLSLGRDVPVMVTPGTPDEAPRSATPESGLARLGRRDDHRSAVGTAPRSTPALFLLSSQPKTTHREL